MAACVGRVNGKIHRNLVANLQIVFQAVNKAKQAALNVNAHPVKHNCKSEKVYSQRNILITKKW
jgi:hypothetical protein